LHTKQTIFYGIFVLQCHLVNAVKQQSHWLG